MATHLPSPIESRAAIADLVHRYALNVRSGNHMACEALMTEDVAFEVRETHPADLAGFRVRSHVVGRTETLAYIGRGSSGLVICPLIHNLLIDLDGSTAQSSCIMESRTFPSGHEVIGEYRDSYRFDGGWRFSRRVYTMYRETLPLTAPQP